MCRTFQSVSAAAGRLARRGSAFLLAAAVGVGAACPVALAENTWEISDGDTVIYHTTCESDPETVLAEAGLELDEADQVSSSTDGDISRIFISRSQTVTVQCDGETLETETCAQTVQEVLDELDICLTDSDRCSEAADAEVSDGMYIEVTRVTEEIRCTESAVPCMTEYYEDPSLPAGGSRVLTDGSDGTVQYTWKVTCEDGVEVSRQLLGSEVLTEAVNEVILVHTDRTMHEHDSDTETTALSYEASSDASDLLPQDDASGTAAAALPQDDTGLVSSEEKSSAVIASEAASSSTGSTAAADGENTLITASGDTLTWTQVLSCTATAYTGGGSTASGTSARVGAVAVDPDVIPLGSLLYIVSDDGYCIYGICVAEDTGSAISGSRVDLYFDTYSECVNFGQRTVTVYVLQTPDTTEEAVEETAE